LDKPSRKYPDLLKPGSIGLVRLGHVMDRVAHGARTGSLARRRVLVGVGLLWPLLLLYRELLFNGSAWLDLDLLLSYQPRYTVLANGIRDGHIPLWTDGMLSGFPIAFSEFGWFYPLTWMLLRVLDPLRAYTLELALGLVFAAVAAYWLGRVWGLTRLAAYLAAFLFTYGAFVFATSRFLNYADIYFALPAGIAAIELVTRGHRRYLALLGLCAAVMGLAGHPQIALLFGFTWMIFVSYRLLCAWRDGTFSTAVVSILWITVAVGAGLLVSAVRLLPTVSTTALSVRASGLDFEVAAQGSIPPWSLILGYLFPSFEIPRVLGDRLNAEELLYLGFATPALALLALCSRNRHRLVWFLTGLVILSWIFAMGSFSLGFPLLHKIPLFGFFRQPARFGIVASFGLAYLAAIGIDQIRVVDLRGSVLAKWVTKIWLWAAGLVGAGTVIATIVLSGLAFVIVPYGYDYIDRAIVGSEGRFLSAERYYRTFDQLYEQMATAFSLEFWTPRWTLLAALLTAAVLWGFMRRHIEAQRAQVMLVGILVIDVLVAPGHMIPTTDTGWYAREPRAAAVMPGHSTDQWRVFSYRGLAQKFELSTAAGTDIGRSRRDLLEYIFLNETLTPNLPFTRAWASIDGYENLMSRPVADYLAYVGSERTTVNGFAVDPGINGDERANIFGRRLPALAVGNVRYVLSGVKLEHPQLVERQSGLIDLPNWSSVQQSLYVYELRGWFPRVWLARDWKTIDVAAASVDVLDAIARRPSVAMVDRDPGLPRGSSGTGLLEYQISRSPHQLTVQVVTDGHGLVVVNEAMYPGWEATIDGQPVEIVTVNTMMRGVPVNNSGVHTIVMSYMPPGFPQAIVLSIFGVGVLLVLLVLGWRVDRT